MAEKQDKMEQTHENMAETKLNWWKQTKMGGLGGYWAWACPVSALANSPILFCQTSIYFLPSQAKPNNFFRRNACVRALVYWSTINLLNIASFIQFLLVGPNK